MKVWMYYETDGDSGYYNIELFITRAMANMHKKMKHSAYGKVEEIEVKE